MRESRVSFVVATYNGAPFVEQQLESILSGLGADDEIVVSDDHSSDDTVARVRAIGDPRVRVMEGERLGYQGNFARAIAASRGSFVFFADQDDVCLPNRIPQSLVALAASSCVCGDAVVVDEGLQPVLPSYFAARRARFSAAALFVRPAVIGATLACRREFLLPLLPFPVGVPHDMWLSVQAARQGQLAIVREPLILYRRHEDALSATATSSRRGLFSRVTERLRLGSAIIRRQQGSPA